MKKLVLKNKELVPCINFIDKVDMVGHASRGRTKLQKRLTEELEDYEAEMNVIRQDYYVLDKDGELVQENNSYSKRDNLTKEEENTLTERVKSLMESDVEVELATYSKKYEAFFKKLDNLEMAISGADAMAYDVLLDAYEANEEEKEEEK